MWKQDQTEGEGGGRSEGGRGPSGDGPALPEEVAFVGKGVDFKGVITYSGTVRIDGSLDGEIHTDGALVIGPEAVLTAKVTAGTVVCHGTITGDIKAKDQIMLCAPAVVQGSLTTPVLAMEEGVLFNGTLEMKAPAQSDASRETGLFAGGATGRLPTQRVAA